MRREPFQPTNHLPVSQRVPDRLLVMDQPANSLVDFLEACRRGDSQQSHLLLLSRVDVNASDLSGNTGLIEAARHHHPSLVKTLLSHSADCNVASVDGNTALIVTAASANDVTMQLLAEAAREAGKSPSSAGAPTMMILNMLLEKRAEVNAVSNSGETALSWAAWSGDLDCVKLLVEHRADVTANGDWPDTPELSASESAESGVLSFFQDIVYISFG